MNPPRCAHCNLPREDHVGGKCLFGPTQFKPESFRARRARELRSNRAWGANNGDFNTRWLIADINARADQERSRR